MQIRAADLAAHLAKRLAPVYAIHGDEPLLAIEAGDLVRAAARQAGCEERDVLVVDAHFNWDQLVAATSNLSLFGSRKLIDLRIPSGRPGASGSEALQKLAAGANPDLVTLVTLPRLDRATQSSAWFSALEQAGVAIAAQPISRAELPRWIGERLARQNQEASRETLEFLADRTEGNLLAAHQEIIKLGLILGTGTLDPAAVAQAMTDVARFDVFDLSEAWLAGDGPRVARILSTLQADGDALQLILWQLGEDLHALCTLGEAASAGVPVAQVLRSVRAWGRRQDLLQSAARRLPLSALRPLLSGLAQLDALSKGIGRHDVWALLIDIALTLAGRPVLVPGVIPGMPLPAERVR